MCECPSVAWLDIHGIDADQLGVATVANAPRDRPETAEYSRSYIAGLTAPTLINAMILLGIQLIPLRYGAILIAPERCNSPPEAKPRPPVAPPTMPKP